METNAELVPYGIFQEASDIRAHVGVLSRAVYVFQTKQMRELISKDPQKYAMADAGQRGVEGRTAQGWLVKWKDVPDLRRLQFHSYNWTVFSEQDSTSEKGKKAVDVVTTLLKLGRFPLWLGAEESKDTSIQIQGTDIIIFHKAKIQVKCDWRAGDGSPGCSGNLFIQNAERNPLKRS